MAEVFTPKADLSGFLETGESLQVSDIYHKAIIEITEGKWNNYFILLNHNNKMLFFYK